MKPLTTPKAILFGMGLLALGLASIPYSVYLITPAHAELNIMDVGNIIRALNNISLSIDNVSSSIDYK